MSASPDGLSLALEAAHTPDASLLLAHLSAELGALYGDDGAGAFTPDDVCVPGSAFVVARFAGRAVGCGALRPLKDDIAEVKRMFVEREERGRGIARRLLAELEATAAALGYRRVWLETGLAQPEAVRLYDRAGYRRIERYGIYVNNPLSVCFEKWLGP